MPDTPTDPNNQGPDFTDKTVGKQRDPVRQDTASQMNSDERKQKNSQRRFHNRRKFYSGKTERTSPQKGSQKGNAAVENDQKNDKNSSSDNVRRSVISAAQKNTQNARRKPEQDTQARQKTSALGPGQKNKNPGNRPSENPVKKNNQGNFIRRNPTGGNRSERRESGETGDQTSSPLVPPEVKPVFIGPELRQIDYQSNRAKRVLSQSPESVNKTTQPYRGRQESGKSGDHRRLNNNRDNRGRKPDRRKNQSTYVSFSDKYNSDRPAPSIPIPTDRGIKLRSQRGGTSRNWWARRWIDAMERLVDPARLQRGRSYARNGQVLSIQETKTGVEAMVQGSRPQPYKVAIQVTSLTNDQWNQVVDALAEQALFTAQLLAGEMPGNIESAFETAGVSLFPNHTGDLNTSCSCPDWANPCKHVAASHYILGDRFDDDPFLLFRMRGRSQEQILEALRERRGGDTEAVDDQIGEIVIPPALEEKIESFWDPGEVLDSFPLTISPPTVDMPMLKRLGEPAFLPGETLQSLLKPVYTSFTYSALRAAYSDDEPLESNSGDENGGDNILNGVVSREKNTP